MTRLIDADALIACLQKDPLYPLVERYGMSGVIDSQPTVDAVEVIRCQDCKYCETVSIFGKTTLYSCTRKNPAVDVLPSDYCSRGRRKDES